MRLFVAVAVPPLLAGPLGEVRPALEPRCPGARWSRPEGLHFTLKFLGHLSEEAVARARRSLVPALAGTPDFEIEVAGLGVFPAVRAPRVLWAGVGEGRAGLEDLARRAEASLAEAGFPREERPYVPHLTLARFSVPPPMGEPFPSEWKDRPFGRFRAGAVHLMESRLRPEGAVHAILETYPLNDTVR